jgi:cyanophycinase
VSDVGLIILVGGNEFRPDCIPMDRAILARLGQPSARVVVVPAAAARENPDLAARNGVRYFSGLGARAEAAGIVTRADADDRDRIAPLARADLVYLTGGDPWYLLETLRGTRALDALQSLLREGRALAGSSAGAMALAAEMLGRDRTSWLPALGIVRGIAVLPHYRPGRAAPAPRAGSAVLGIPEATACVTEGDGAWTVLGTGRVGVSSAGTTTEYGPGESFRVEGSGPPSP